jgi:thiol-disulfide isomerase/thioredoxin
MKKRLILTAVCCLAIFALTYQPAVALEKELGIGSPAPALDIEHWIQDGNGFFKPVKKFEDGKVYVVEFWATWCGPCIGSMPHLAELQQKYRGRGVQIISISDETPEEVNTLLEKENPDVGKTFAEITSAYSLTTDPDGSSHKDYMEAAKQQGIPTSFIVGKTGQIEWIGHPMELDEPLAAVVAGSWDREAFKQAQLAKAEFENAMQRISMLAGAEKYADAIKLADEQLKKVEDDQAREELTRMRNSLKLAAGQLDDDVLKYFQSELAKLKGNPVSVGRFGYFLASIRQGGGEIGSLADEAIAELNNEAKKADDDLKPLLFHAMARLHNASGQLPQAIAAQKQAIELSDGRQKDRLTEELAELEKTASGDKESDEKENAAEDAGEK